ncbi:MAG: PKD domain-containing protein [Euryarchaeota archaeon]|nr:PKD domain-containing protein [Euryarchaeota archaeon]
MNKKILCILVCMLMTCVTASTVTATKNNDANPATIANNNNMQNRNPWDLIGVYDIGATGQTQANGNSGSECDGTYMYSTRWASNLIHRYNQTGVLVEEFSIPGVSGLRDLTYDGTYMYGGASAGTIYKMDFTTKTLIGTITGGFQCRAIAYDSDLDVFYVKNWGDPCWIVDRSGAITGQFNLGTTISTYGLAYDPSGPYLYVFDQGDGTQSIIYQWDLTAGSYTGVTFDVGPDVGSGIGIAGGLWVSNSLYDNKMVIGGVIQDSTAPGVSDYLFVYELYPLSSNNPPAIPTAPDGPTSGSTGISYSFTASTTDPETEDIYYKFSWGDGNESAWLGPFASGATATGSHIWSTAGDFDIKVKAKDINDAESDWSPVHTITIAAGPSLVIQPITGGLLKVKTSIKNTGGAAATAVDWSIKLDGGIILLGKESTGTIATIAAGGEVAISSKLILGFGATVITVTAGTASATQNAKVLLFLIKIV